MKEYAVQLRKPTMSFTKEAVYYDIFHTDKNYRKEAKAIRKQYPDAKTVLEIGSGTGALTGELKRCGFIVDCIEPSKEMVENNTAKPRTIIVAKIEDIVEEWDQVPESTFEKKYDLVLAMYDVLNYVPHNKYEMVIGKLKEWGTYLVTEMWSFDGVKPIQFRRFGKYWRLRLGFKLRNTVHLWYIFGGASLVVEKHTLYIHV